jgi:hypothetical protein
MKPQHFVMLALAAVISLAGAIAVYVSSTPWSVENHGGGALFPALKADVANVRQIEISQGPKSLVLERDGEAWRVKSRDGYPAASDNIRVLLSNLTDAVLAESKTRNPQRFALLELEDPKDANSNSRLIRLLDEKGGVVAEVILGKKRAAGTGLGGTGTYVRKPGDDQTWLASTDISGGLELRDWTKARIVEMPADKITKVRIEIPGDAPYEIVRETGGQHKLAEIPAGKKIKYVNAVDNVVEATSYVEFQDVRKATEGGGDVTTAYIETESGLKMTYKLRHEGDDVWWLTITPSGDGDAKKAAEELAQRTQGWEFRVVRATADAIKRRDELLEDSSS